MQISYWGVFSGAVPIIVWEAALLERKGKLWCLSKTVLAEILTDPMRDYWAGIDIQNCSQSWKETQAFVAQNRLVTGYKRLLGREQGIGWGSSLQRNSWRGTQLWIALAICLAGQGVSAWVLNGGLRCCARASTACTKLIHFIDSYILNIEYKFANVLLNQVGMLIETNILTQ